MLQTRAILALRSEVSALARRITELAKSAEAERLAHRESTVAVQAQADLVRRSVAAVAAPLEGRWFPIVAAGFLGICVGLGLAGAHDLAQLVIGVALKQWMPK